MTLVLDSSILFDMEKGFLPTIEKLAVLTREDRSPPAITFVNHFEFLAGVYRRRGKHDEVHLVFINKFIVLQTTRATSMILSSLKNKYDSLGVGISLSDLIITALCIENGMTLVTRDRDFEKIAELKKVIL
ncbi:MAG: type II toxin-antitoxin system VapC family toxin [Nanoarchaeota archaeon]